MPKKAPETKRKASSPPPSREHYITCPITEEKVYISTVTLSQLRQGSGGKHRRELLRIPSKSTRQDVYKQTAFAIQEKEILALPLYGKRPWSVVVKVTESSSKKVKTPLFRWFRGQVELACLPHFLEKIPTTNPTCQKKQYHGKTQRENQATLDERITSKSTDLEERTVSNLSTVAWIHSDEYSIPNVSKIWTCPLRRTFYSRKAAWQHASELMQRQVFCDKILRGYGARGQELVPFKPTKSQALKAGKIRFLRDGLWIVGQEESWQTQRMEELQKQKQQETSEEEESLEKNGETNNNKEEKEEPVSGRRLSGVQYYIKCKRDEFRAEKLKQLQAVAASSRATGGAAVGTNCLKTTEPSLGLEAASGNDSKRDEACNGATTSTTTAASMVHGEPATKLPKHQQGQVKSLFQELENATCSKSCTTVKAAASLPQETPLEVVRPQMKHPAVRGTGVGGPAVTLDQNAAKTHTVVQETNPTNKSASVACSTACPRTTLDQTTAKGELNDFAILAVEEAINGLKHPTENNTTLIAGTAATSGQSVGTVKDNSNSIVATLAIAQATNGRANGSGPSAALEQTAAASASGPSVALDQTTAAKRNPNKIRYTLADADKELRVLYKTLDAEETEEWTKRARQYQEKHAGDIVAPSKPRHRSALEFYIRTNQKARRDEKLSEQQSLPNQDSTTEPIRFTMKDVAKDLRLEWKTLSQEEQDMWKERAKKEQTRDKSSQDNTGQATRAAAPQPPTTVSDNCDIATTSLENSSVPAGVSDATGKSCDELASEDCDARRVTPSPPLEPPATADETTTEPMEVSSPNQNCKSSDQAQVAVVRKRKRSNMKQITPSVHWRLDAKAMELCFNAAMDHYRKVMHTVKARALHNELADGFDLLRERGRGRFDMELPVFDTPEFSFLTDIHGASWMPIVREILGQDIILIHKGVFLSMPGAEAQVYHQDGPHLTKKCQRPCHAVNVFIPLVDLTMRNGPTEFCLGTHILGHEDYNRDFTETPVVQAGTPVIFDYRLGHRGLGNTSNACRPIVYCTYASKANGKEFRDSVNFSRRRYRKLGDLVELPLSREERAKKRQKSRELPVNHGENQDRQGETSTTNATE